MKTTKTRRLPKRITLRQRQSHMVSLLRKAKLGAHAKAVDALDFSDLDEAKKVFAAARAAASAGATKEQLEWIAEKLGIEDVPA